MYQPGLLVRHVHGSSCGLVHLVRRLDYSMAVPTYGWSLEKQVGSMSLHRMGRPRLNCSGETNGTFPAPFAREPPFRYRPVPANVRLSLYRPGMSAMGRSRPPWCPSRLTTDAMSAPSSHPPNPSCRETTFRHPRASPHAPNCRHPATPADRYTVPAHTPRAPPPERPSTLPRTRA